MEAVFIATICLLFGTFCYRLHNTSAFLWSGYKISLKNLGKGGLKRDVVSHMKKYWPLFIRTFTKLTFRAHFFQQPNDLADFLSN